MKTWTPKATDAKKADLVHHVGYDLLGPVVQRWLLALHQHLAFHDDGDTVALFCARAGVRIAELYDLFLRERCAAGPPSRMFWISRLAVAKGVFANPGGQKPSIELLTREYRHLPLRDLVTGIMRQCPDLLSDIDLRDRSLDAHGHNFAGWLTVNGPVQRRVRDFLTESTVAFETYVDDLLDGRRRALLIDSGWQGTTQSLLSSARPDTDWRGLYFGRILTPEHDRRIVQDCIGLLFEAETWDPDRPETAFVRHRHLIETLLEPAAPSVEDVRGGPAHAAVEAMIEDCRHAPPDPETDALYLAVRSYVTDNSGQRPSRILAAHSAAMPELARMLVRPRAEEVAVLATGGRSADFGKSLVVPVVTDPDEGHAEDRDGRIDHALWPEGQIALEFPPAAARDLQDRVSGSARAIRPAGPGAGIEPRAARPQGAERVRVAIITRTKNRPILLRRAAQSVARQTFRDITWTIVNDGGDPEEVIAILRDAPIDPRSITLVSHEESQGMEAASNAGIAACDSDYIVIHDDDDSWCPDFLEKTVAFLDGPAGARYGGVTTHSTYVSEEIRGDRVIEHETRPYNDWVRNVQLSEMACGNFFPPIAFLFRRAVLDRVGGFNEALPVLGDWFFNLEVLLEDDIAVLPEALARYHHRDRGDTTSAAYANSVIGGVSKHEEFAAIARNAFLRRHGDRAGVAASFAMGYAISDLRNRIGQNAETKACPPVRPMKVCDDRLWCVRELNEALSRRGLWRRIRRGPPIPDDIGWSDLARRMKRSGIALRAPQDFDEDGYLRSNPDVAWAVQQGKLGTGYMHYVLHGRTEGRPRPARGTQ
jgi:glycosyltransferase involved in cell wall biosynthesis